MTYVALVRRPDPRLPESWCREGVAHDHGACGSLWDSTDARDLEEARRWADRQGTGTDNPKDTNQFGRVGLIVGRFRGMDPETTIAAVATSDGATERLTYGDLRDLLSTAFDAGDRLQDIAARHSRESGSGGLCLECAKPWPCETRKTAEGAYVAPDDRQHPCGDHPAPCNCDDPLTHNGR